MALGMAQNGGDASKAKDNENLSIKATKASQSGSGITKRHNSKTAGRRRAGAARRYCGTK